MNKSLISKFSFVLLAALAITFTGCNKDDDDNGGSTVISGNKITVTVAGVGDKVDNVKAELYYEYTHPEYGYENYDYELIAEVEFKNNSFTVELPATIDSKFLHSVVDEYDDEGVNISNPDAKVSWDLDFRAYKGDDRVGYFYYENNEGDNESYVWIVYADRDVSITGTYKSEYSSYIQRYNVNLKKGWNYVSDVYIGEDKDGNYIYEESSSIPAGVKWIFESDSYYKSAEASPKKVKGAKL
jgi:hypothetical protein